MLTISASRLLVAQLRELVPPQRQPGGQRSGPQPSNETLEARRPKHVVLADTIALLKAMQTTTGKVRPGGP